MTQTHSPQFLNLMPAEAVSLPIEAVLAALEREYGAQFYAAFENEKYPCPVQNQQNSDWIKRANTVGVNVRTIGDFWSLVPYSMTLPTLQNALHLLPIFEPGVVSSLYGPTSWNINPEFFNHRLASLFPHLDTVEKQLSLTIRLLHLLGKAVGLDVIPHVDRYAEQVLANPSFFEWIQRDDMSIVDHSSELYLQVQTKLYDFLRKRGSLLPEAAFPGSETAFFDALPEKQRLRMMFGEKQEYEFRLKNRIEMVDFLYQCGYETLPATMGPPYRGIEVDPNPEAKIIDAAGRVWRDYRITKPEKFSRVFGPLARFKLYEPENNNGEWQLNFERPFVPAWDYVCASYGNVQATFDFDFMRGDMSHVQMRPGGTPDKRDKYYDLLGAVKQSVLPEKPYFGYFAESFLAPPGEMAYGDECDHLEASYADSTLGDLQSEPMGTERFVQEFQRYISLLQTRLFAPNFTVMTADKDDPRFDSFYLTGNEARYFMALFLPDMPSYMALGFECRDPHPKPAPNEYYTKLYVFQVDEGPKSTNGPYIWGRNEALYRKLCQQKTVSESLFSHLQNSTTEWLIAPDPTGKVKVIAWKIHGDSSFVFLVNMGEVAAKADLAWPLPEGNWRLHFSSAHAESQLGAQEHFRGRLSSGECQVWERNINFAKK